MVNMIKKVILGLVVVAFALPATSSANSHESNKRMKADADGDGNVTWQEYVSAAKQRFERKDANGDGVLSKDEMKHHKKMKDMKNEKKGKDRKKGHEDDAEEDDGGK